MNNVILNLKSVGKAFEERRVLKNIELEISAGESVFICGINGVGKSTLLRIAAGLLQPDTGSIEICGWNIGKDPEKAKPKLGVISHKSMIYADLTVLENLLFFANLYGVKEPLKRANELLDDLELGAYRYDQAGILSRGLLQRLSIARAIVHKPVLLLADEPFTGLDNNSCKHLVSILTKFVDDSHAVLMTTHDADIGLRCSGRVVVLDKCSIIFDAPTSQIDPSKFSKDYVGYAGSHG